MLQIWEIEAYDKALEILRTGAADPTMALSAVKRAAELMSPLLAGIHRRRWPVNRVLVPAITGVVTVGGGVLTPIADQEVKFPAPGRVLGMKASAVANGAIADGGRAADHVTVGVKINGDLDLFSSGRAGTEIPLSHLLSSSAVDSQGWYPLDNEVLPSDSWFVRFSSTDDVTLGARQYTPRVSFLMYIYPKE